MIFTYTEAQAYQSGPGPSSVPRKQYYNNGYLTPPMAMPFKPPTMTQGSMFSNARKVFVKDAGGGPNWYAGSDITALKRVNAIGKSSTKTGLPNNAKLSYRSQDNNFKNSALRRCRSGGSVAPKKKGALKNPYKGSGCCTSGPCPPGYTLYRNRCRELIQIYIQAPNGSKITLNVGKSDTIKMVKDILSELLGVHSCNIAHMKLLLGSEELTDDDKTLEEYSINHTFTLHLLL